MIECIDEMSRRHSPPCTMAIGVRCSFAKDEAALRAVLAAYMIRG